MKKQQRMIALLGVLVLLLGVYYVITKSVESAEQAEAEAVAAEKALLLSESVTDIAGVAFTSQEGTEVAFTLVDDIWYLSGDETFDVDETVLDSMVTDLTGIEIEVTLTEIESLTEYGLDEPINEITVTKADGSNVTIYLGDENVATGIYYVCLSNDMDTVYCINVDLASTFDMALEDMRYVEENTEEVLEETMEEDATTE